ncbi:MAG: hypothetical protein WD184_03590 [Acidimicrobiia bacterium]
MNKVPLNVIWLAIFLVCAILLGVGREALTDALESQGLSSSGLAFLAAIAFLTAPVVVAVPLIVWVLREYSGPLRLGLVALIVYSAGYAASLMRTTTGIEASRMVECSDGATGLMLCGISRGVFMLTTAYSWQFLLSGIFISLGLVYSVSRAHRSMIS